MSQPESIDDSELIPVTCEEAINPLEFKQKIKRLAEDISCKHNFQCKYDFPKWSPGIACLKIPAARKEKILDAVQGRSWLAHDSSLKYLF